MSNAKQDQVQHDVTRWSDYDIYLLKQGRHFRLFDKLGAHEDLERGGTYFSVWAPAARSVSVIGDFNDWQQNSHQLTPRWDSSGIWEGFIPGLNAGSLYKYHIASENGSEAQKADPVGFWHEEPPRTASRIWRFEHVWHDQSWMAHRGKANALDAPMSIYEMHLGSWKRDAQGHMLTYKELAVQLVDYITKMGYTHVEFLPVTEHPFYGSWGYQTTGYFAPTARYGTPDDFMFLVDALHQAHIGVLLDWVPSHFPDDPHGLALFDGTHLYEHADPRLGFHPDWKSYIFNFGRLEVRAFLISSAAFWLKQYHIDGLRVDAVASMLYLDYSRKEGEWIPNREGGRENLDAIDFLKSLNTHVYLEQPDIQMIAEESTAWPKVSRPVDAGGLGFGLKWNMGWMHDTLAYFKNDPIHRKFHHNQLTFSLWYAFNENFLLSLSHDEGVHGKLSLANKMPGDRWQKMANLRLLLGYMFAHPGKKLLFMGNDFTQWHEWNHDTSLDWHLLEEADHAGMQQWVADLNHLYRRTDALHQIDFAPEGFEWIDASDADQSVLSFLRRADHGPSMLVVANFTPLVRRGYHVGVPAGGTWREVLNSDATTYAGSGVTNGGQVVANETSAHGRTHSLELTLPPLGVCFFEQPD
ncbi:MAG: 1,4-alpha-glucan branching protein GlgB [Deltaproteobacteria bacterium]|nr:1,4-alpha-glucan branching protein GlgB [Deltaproteobacteria bacterium]